VYEKTGLLAKGHHRMRGVGIRKPMRKKEGKHENKRKRGKNQVNTE
jgi:hypothetical protein